MKKKKYFNYATFIAPTMVLFLLVYAAPVIVLFGSSLCNWRIGDAITFCGLGNYMDRSSFCPDPGKPSVLLEICQDGLHDSQYYLQRGHGNAVSVYF